MLASKQADGRAPATGSLELTQRCNLTCQHCYVNEPAHDRAIRSRELSTDQIKAIIDQVVEEGALYLTLTGGEVFLRPDFREIYLYARQQGLLVTIFTNATLITPRIADFLAEYPPVTMEITIYGHTEETYEIVTGIKGSFAKFRRGVGLVVERGLNLVMKTVVMTLNQHEFSQMKEWAEGLGADFRYDTTIFARLDGGQQPCMVRVSPEKATELEMYDPKTSTEMGEYYERIGESGRMDDDALYRCGAGKNTWHVNAYGEIALCTISKPLDYDLKKGSFGEAWHGPVKEMSERKRSDVFSKCRTCQVKQYCTLCPAKATLESGNPEFHLDYFCQIAETRAAAYAPKDSKIINLVSKTPLTEIAGGCSCH